MIVKKLKTKYKYLTGFFLILMVWVVAVQTTDNVGLIKIANANQVLKASAIKPLGEGLDLAAFSPDGNILASVDPDGQILFSDVASGQIRLRLPGLSAGMVSGIVFSPDGNTLASVNDKDICLWDVASGKRRLILHDNHVVTDLEFSPNSKTLAAVNLNSGITLWNSQSGSITQVLTGDQTEVNTIAFSPDSKILAVGTQDAQIKLWDRATGIELASLPGGIGAAVTDLEFSPNGKNLAAVGQDSRITLWDSQSENSTHVLSGHRSGVNTIAFSPDSKFLASGGQDAQIKLWDNATGLEQYNLQVKGAVTGLVFSQDGKTLASIGESESVFLWDLGNKLSQLLTGHIDWLDKIVFSANQKTLASLGKTGQVVVWNLKTGLEKLAFQVSLSDPASTSAQGVTSVSASGNLLSNTTNTNTTKTVANGSVSSSNGIGQLTAGAAAISQSLSGVNQKLSNHDWKGVTALAISPDGALYGGVTQDGAVRLWDSNGKQSFAVSEHHGAAVTGVAFTADGKQLVSVGRDSEIQIRDVANGKKTQTLFAHEQPIRAVAASSNGKYFASAGEETRVMLWDAQTKKLIKIFSGHTSIVNAVSFSANGTQLASASADGRILVWDVSTGKLVQTLLGHSGEVNAAAFSKDGKFFASAGADSLVILWDATTGKQIQRFSGHSAAVRAVAFSPNGQQLVSTGEDTKILVWNTLTHKLDKQVIGSVTGVTGSVNVINSIVFNPLGKLITGSESGEVSELDVKSDQTKQVVKVPLQPQVSNFEAFPVLTSNGPISKNAVKTAQTNILFNVFNQVLEWIIPSAEAALADPNQGPGGPILVVTTASDPFGKYYAEILHTEGLNEFAVADISTVSATTLSNYDMVILARMTLTSSQVSVLTNWVTAGGHLIAMRPDAQLAGLLGVTPSGTTLANGYLLVDTSRSPGNGIASQTLQFHGVADRYTVSTASSLATLYTNATTATTNPAVTLQSVGVSGGQAAAFTYDLASSTVYTRQGNPAWAIQERDGYAPIRSDDKFYGNANWDPQPDWVDPNNIAIPQADEQQRLFANLIMSMNLDKKPLPRFWYFPNGKKAVVIMTGDDHGNGGTAGRFDQFKALSPVGCNVANWECIRGTSYIFVEPANLSNAQAVAYTADGFEVGLHVNTNCADFTPATLDSFYVQQTANFQTNYPGIPAPITQRHHCIAWSDWVTGAQIELKYGIRLDTSYYFWPPGWVGNQPGNFTGSAMPMRFTDVSGNIVDVYQAASQMTDESGQAYPLTINALLDRALGVEGYYGAYTINAHTDVPQIPEATAVVASAQARGVPVVSSVQMLTWLDGRNNSSFGNLSWNGSALNFTVTPGAGANGLQAMLPMQSTAGVLAGLIGPGGAVNFTTTAIKGVNYAFFAAGAGAYVATYGADIIPPTVLSTSPVNTATGANPFASVTATFSKGMKATTINTANFELRDGANSLVPATVNYNESGDIATLTPSSPLAVQSVYTAKIKGGVVTDIVGNALAADYIWSFTPGSLSGSAWSGSATPTTPSVNDSGSVELGVKFKVDVAGSITGIRFYKGAGNTGVHTGNLWSASGTKLATATFANETASGWQQVTLTTPVAVTPGTVYVASYFAPNGNYAGDSAFFTNAGVDTPPIHLLQNGVSGGNGVYVYGGSSAFPNQTYLSTNYWVDVLFAPRTGPAPLSLVSTVPAIGAIGVSTGLDGSHVTMNASFNNTLNPATITGATFTLQDSNNMAVPTSVSVKANTVTLLASSALNPSSIYTVTLTTGIQDNNGSSLAANYTWSFTTGVVPVNCNAPPNPIAAENCLGGNPSTEWAISGGTDAAGDPTIQGFATDISVNQGGTVNFKIDVPVNIPYRLDIYRMGYYDGAGARKVDTVNPTMASHSQPACMTDLATGLIDCGNWAVSGSWTVPSNATSGIYFARAVRTDTGGASHIVFIVRSDTSHSDLIFQTSDTSWQAYNDYGGNNLYIGSPGTNPSRAYKVSYNRPFHTRVYEPQTWLFNAEYPMVRWLEANGYDVSYSTGVDTERNAALIKNHKTWLSNGHDEYWSAGQRASVQAARDAGVHLAFFSGNTMYWKTRWENAIDGSGTPYRTLVCYKETQANAKIDPLPTWTGTWRDPRFSPPLGTSDGGQPENALKGTLFRMNGDQVVPIGVPQSDGQMRFWRNTSVATLGAGQVATLAPGTIGAEFDDDEDNGFRPAGLFGLSNTPVTDSGNYLLDYGSTYGAGTSVHKVTLYKAPSGAWVFASGTYQWSWGLDANHDRSNLGATTDVRMQQATVNLFADMGVQPTSLQGGLVIATASTDTTAPTSAILSPTTASNLTQGSLVTVSGTATDATGGVVAGVEVSVDGGVTWHPATGRSSWSYSWTPSVAGSLTIKSRAVDDSGNIGLPGAGINVTVATAISCASNCNIWPGTTAPTLVDAGPDSAVELGVKFKSDVTGIITGIRFYKASTNIGTHVGNLWSSAGTLLASATFSGETASGWQQVSFSTPVAVTANTVYVASYHANSGHYSADLNYFISAGVDNLPLHALANGVSGSDGVYAYGTKSVFPNLTWNSSNYWVDVVFSAGSAPTLSSIAVTPASPTITTGNTPLQFTATGTYSNSSTQNLTSQVTWASSNTAIATVNVSGLATAIGVGSTTISATSGSVSANSILTINAAPLNITTTLLPTGTINVGYPLTTLAASGGTTPYQLWSITTGALPAGLSLNASTGAITGTPTSVGTFSFTVQVSDSSNPTAMTATKAISITIAQASSNTGFLAPNANTAVITGAGDNNGFESNPSNAYLITDGLFAVDTNSGNNTNTSCTNAGKDKHDFYNFNISLPPTASTIQGIEVQLKAKVNSASSSPSMCVQLSWNGGVTWTTTQSTPLSTTNTLYTLGGIGNVWGRTWAISDFSNANFMVRIINVASSTSRTFSLDGVAIRATYQ
jgi:WD40 repeat protein